MKSFNQFLNEAEDLTPDRPKPLNGEPLIDVNRRGRRIRKRSTATTTTSDPQVGPRTTRTRTSALRPEYFEGGELKPDAWKKFAQKQAAKEYGRGQSVTPGTARGDKILGDLKDVGDLIKRSDEGSLSGSDKARIDAINQRIIDKHGAANQYKPSTTPTRVTTTSSSALGDFIRKTQEGGKPVSQELTDVAGIKASGMKPELVGGAPPTTAQVNRARAKADAIRAQQQPQRRGQGSGAQTLRRLVGKPDQGMQRLQRAIDNIPDTPAPRGQGARPVGSTAPRGAARVTYGQGAAPTKSFAAFSQKATAMQPPASKAVQQRVAQAATAQAAAAKPPTFQQQVAGAARDVMSDMEKKKIENRTKRLSAIGDIAKPLAAAASTAQGYRSGIERGENPLVAISRGATRAIGGGIAAGLAGGSALKRRKPGLAIPAATAAYPAGEATADFLFNKVKGLVRGLRK
jgi:hypothetical protein